MGAVREFIIYMLFSPLTGVPFYIGIGRYKRPRDHFYDAADSRVQTRKAHKIRKLLAAGYCRADIIAVIATDLTLNEAKVGEEWLVRSWGRVSHGNGPLLNETWGGDTAPAQEPEQRAASSARMRERYKHPEERAAAAERQRAAWARDPERKQQLAVATAAHWSDPVQREAHAAALAAAAQRPETQARRSESQLAAWAHPEAAHRRDAMASPEARTALREAQARPEVRERCAAVRQDTDFRAKLSDAKAAYWAAGDHRDELAERNRQRWSDPEARERWVAALNEPEALEHRKAAARTCWTRPEYRERQRVAQEAARERKKKAKAA